MKKNMKTLALAMAVIMLVAVLAACTDKANEPNTTPSTDPILTTPIIDGIKEPVTVPEADPTTEPVTTNEISIGENEKYTGDIDNDGEEETIKIITDYDAYQVTFTITDNGEDIKTVLNASGFVKFLIMDLEPADEMTNFVVSVSSDGGECETHIYRYNGVILEESRIEALDNNGELIDTNGIYGGYMRMDGKNIVVESIVDILGTWGGLVTYVPSDINFGYYQLDGAVIPTKGDDMVVIEVSKEFDVKLDENGSEKDGKLEVGTKLQVTGTDCHSYVTFKTEDGVTGKIEITVSEYGAAFIDGNDCGEYFKELFYAG